MIPVRESAQLRTVLAMCEQEINQDRSKSSYQNLKTMVRHTHQMIRTRNFKETLPKRNLYESVDVDQRNVDNPTPPGNSLWPSLCAPPPWFLTLWKVKGEEGLHKSQNSL